MHTAKGPLVFLMTDLKPAANVMREQALLSQTGQDLD